MTEMPTGGAAAMAVRLRRARNAVMVVAALFGGLLPLQASVTASHYGVDTATVFENGGATGWFVLPAAVDALLMVVPITITLAVARRRLMREPAAARRGVRGATLVLALAAVVLFLLGSFLAVADGLSIVDVCSSHGSAIPIATPGKCAAVSTDASVTFWISLGGLPVYAAVIALLWRTPGRMRAWSGR